MSAELPVHGHTKGCPGPWQKQKIEIQNVTLKEVRTQYKSI